MIHQVDKNTIGNYIQKNPMRLVIVDFYADWCAPCKAIAPVLEKLSNSYKHVVFLKIDNDTNAELSEKFFVESLPTLLFIKSNKVIDKIEGFNNDIESRIVEKINQHAFLI